MDDKIARDIALALSDIAKALESIDANIQKVVGWEEFGLGRKTYFIKTGEILRETE